MSATPHWGETSQHVSRACANSVRNASHTDTAISAARHVSNSIAFAPVSNVPAFHTFERVHTHAHRFKCVLWAFTAFLFSRRATDTVFRKSRHLATFGWTDAPAQIRDAQKTGLLKFARGMGVQQERRGNGRAQGDWHLSAKKFFLKK